MCEIAVLKTERFSPNKLTDYAMYLYQSNRTALGLVAVYEEDDSFRYEEFKSFEPESEDVKTFFATFNDAEWTIIHGRLGTSGADESLQATHPIHLECSECSIESVIHNGVVADFWMASALRKDGHQYKTNVDTESIAHQFGDVPETIEEADNVLDEYPSIVRQLGFILLGEKRIYHYARKYQLNEHGEMYHRRRPYANDDAENNYQQMIIKAGA